MAFNLIGRLGLDTKPFEGDLSHAERLYEDFAHRVHRIHGREQTALARAFVGGFGATEIARKFKEQLDQAAKLNVSAGKTGVSIERYQELEYAAQKTDR